MKRPGPTPTVCPVCGESVPPGSLACPGCGADENTGWNAEGTSADGLDLPEEDFDYDAFRKKTFGPPRSSTPWLWWVVAIVLVLVFIISRVAG